MLDEQVLEGRHLHRDRSDAGKAWRRRHEPRLFHGAGQDAVRRQVEQAIVRSGTRMVSAVASSTVRNDGSVFDLHKWDLFLRVGLRGAICNFS